MDASNSGGGGGPVAQVSGFRSARLAVVVIVLLLRWGLAVPVGSAAEWFLAPDGDDANPGTMERPFRSLERARDRLREAPAAAGDSRRVTLRGGVYRLVRPVVFDPRDAGTAESPVVYGAFPGETPILSGARSVTGWELFDPGRGIFVAEVPIGTSSRDFYVDGRRRPRAHSGSWSSAAFRTTDSGLEVAAGLVADWAGSAVPELVVRHEWRDPRVRVLDWKVDGPLARLGLDPEIWRYLRPLLEPGAGGSIRYAENGLGFLDEPGEWHLDESAGRLYYRPQIGERAEGVVGELGVTEELVVVRGDGVDRPTGHLQFRGLTFAETTWLRPSGHSHMVSQANLVSAWDPVDFYERNLAPESRLPGAAVRLGHAVGVSFERCRWVRLGCAGLNLYAGSHGVRVEGCVFDGLGGTAVHVGEPGERDRNNVRPEDPRYLVRDVILRNNFVHRCGDVYLGSVGVFVGFADSVTMEHNRLEDLPQSGFSVGWGWAWEIHTASRNHRIGYNRLRDVVNSDLNDGGAIYTLGAQPGTRVHGNYVRHQARNYSGLYPDIGTAFVEFTENVLRDMPYWLLIHDPSTVSNTFTGNWSATRHLSVNDNGNRIADQHFVDDGLWPEAALALIRGAGIEPAYADIQPRGIELVTPMDRSETGVGRALTLEAGVFGRTEEVRAVHFRVDGNVVGADTNGVDGWSMTWAFAAPGESSVSAEVEWLDGTRQTSDVSRVRVGDGLPGRIRVARASGPGVWVIEAESFAVNWRDAGYATEWVEERGASAPPGVRGSAMRTRPETNWFLDPPWLEYAPRLEFPIRLDGAPLVYVWLRVEAPGAGAGSVHVVLDGVDPVPVQAGAPGSGWAWSGTTPGGGRAVLRASGTGLHHLLVLMREDGLALDTVVLTTDPDFRPGDGVLPAPESQVEDEKPVFRIQVSDSQAHESPIERGQVKVLRSGPTGDRVIPVPLRTVGTATSGTDFVPLPASMEFAETAGSATREATVSILPLADTDAEPEETVGLRLEAGEDYLLTWPAEGFVALLDAGTSESATWRAGRFADPGAGVAEDAADPDGDGWSNLLEESMDTDPLKPLSGAERNKLPRAWLGEHDGQACFYLRYYRPFSGRQVPNLSYAVEENIALGEGVWREVVPDWVGMDLPEYLGGVYPGRFVRMRFPLPREAASGAGGRFFRIAIRRR